MDVKGGSTRLQLFNKSKLRNWIKTFLYSENFSLFSSSQIKKIRV